MLQPKRTKYRRPQKGRCKGNAMRGNQLAFGSFGIKSLDTHWITARQIEAARVAKNSPSCTSNDTLDSALNCRMPRPVLYILVMLATFNSSILCTSIWLIIASSAAAMITYAKAALP